MYRNRAQQLLKSMSLSGLPRSLGILAEATIDIAVNLERVLKELEVLRTLITTRKKTSEDR